MQHKPSPAGKGDHAVVDEESKHGKTSFYSSVNFVDTFYTSQTHKGAC